MILRFKLYSIAGATALLSTPGVDAFSAQKSTGKITTSTRNKQSSSRLHQLSPDWNNDDFMEALGGGSEAIEKANTDYKNLSENRAALDEWRYNQAMKEQGQPGQPNQQPPPQSMPQQPPSQPQMGVPPPPQAQQQTQPPPQQFFDANGNPVTMPVVYDANGNPIPFNPAAAQQQQPAQPAAAVPTFEPNLPNALEPPLPVNPKSSSVDPRPAGFNSDSYTMSNTADVYFAQLKQDSKVRKIARLSGDRETSEQVFAHDSVKHIGDSWNPNPYTKEKNLAEARAEIEGTVRMQSGTASEFGDRTKVIASGPSYKEKLAQMKAQRGGGVAASSPPIAAAKVEAPKVEAPPVAAVAPPKIETPKVAAVAPPPPQPKVGMSVPPVTTTPPAAATPPPAAAVTPAAASGATDEEDARRKIRTLQGLLLKQRGGPGFGAGRLRTPEAQRLEDTLEDVLGILRSEVGAKPAAPVVDAVVESKPVVPTPIAATPPPPPPPQTIPAQAATTASVSTPPPPATADPLAGSIACVEAVLNMYKAASPTERESLLTPVRDALMGAASASNKNIAEGELDAHKKAMEAGPSAAAATDATAPMMGFPTTYAVTKPDEVSATESTTTPPPIVATTETISPATSSNGQAENDKKLEEVYTALVNARDDSGTLGLKNMSGNEANDLADKLVTMRTVLLDELN